MTRHGEDEVGWEHLFEGMGKRTNRLFRNRATFGEQTTSFPSGKWIFTTRNIMAGGRHKSWPVQIRMVVSSCLMFIHPASYADASCAAACLILMYLRHLHLNNSIALGRKECDTWDIIESIGGHAPTALAHQPTDRIHGNIVLLYWFIIAHFLP